MYVCMYVSLSKNEYNIVSVCMHECMYLYFYFFFVEDGLVGCKLFF